ncbi:hypothetical protein GALMADRAFT_463693 [Galerina marginata CBS 339.88]|uniref:Uncharacterized protein n=1 Tax=Galerina marginata (strain CBS 339.88) TaxID=685588 RepID=A0A067T1F4_GALM3|nr:hypothetical protein GALMADRAFT_463693 [Galerina marginata CBS 339.88]
MIATYIPIQKINYRDRKKRGMTRLNGALASERFIRRAVASATSAWVGCGRETAKSDVGGIVRRRRRGRQANRNPATPEQVLLLVVLVALVACELQVQLHAGRHLRSRTGEASRAALAHCLHPEARHQKWRSRLARARACGGSGSGGGDGDEMNLGLGSGAACARPDGVVAASEAFHERRCFSRRRRSGGAEGIES